MGWIVFNICFGLRIDLGGTSAKSLAELRAVLDSIKQDVSNPRSAVVQGFQLSSLKTTLENTEGEGRQYEEDDFGEMNSRDNCYMLYASALELNTSNGSTVNTNMAYSGGHVEFYHGSVRRPLDPTPEQVDVMQEVARRIGMPYQLSWSLRSRSSWATTLKWPVPAGNTAADDKVKKEEKDDDPEDGDGSGAGSEPERKRPREK
jgi:hypothetical protein